MSFADEGKSYLHTVSWRFLLQMAVTCGLVIAEIAAALTTIWPLNKSI